MMLIRSVYLTGFAICLPLLLQLLGSLNAAEIGVNSASIILDALKTLLLILTCAIFLFTAWFLPDYSLRDCLIANCLLILLPLPFFALAWLAAAINALAALKIILFLIGAALLALGLFWLIKLRQTPIRLELLLSVAASICLFSKIGRAHV